MTSEKRRNSLTIYPNKIFLKKLEKEREKQKRSMNNLILFILNSYFSNGVNDGIREMKNCNNFIKKILKLIDKFKYNQRDKFALTFNDHLEELKQEIKRLGKKEKE